MELKDRIDRLFDPERLRGATARCVIGLARRMDREPMRVREPVVFETCSEEIVSKGIEKARRMGLVR